MWLFALSACGAPPGTLTAGGWVACIAAGTRSECKAIRPTDTYSGGDSAKNFAHDGEEVVPAGDWTALSPGFRHTCGLDRAGNVSCWGFDAFGQLDAPPGPFVSVSSGAHMNCALDAAGAASCWGQTKVWDATRTGLPRDPPEVFDALVALDSGHCGLVGTHIHCGGEVVGDRGAPDGGGFVAIAAQGTEVCGLTAQGGVRCGREQRLWQPAADDEQFDGPVTAIALMGRSGPCGLQAGDLVCAGFKRPGPFTEIAAGRTFVCVRGDGVKCFDTDGEDVTPFGW